MKIKLSLFIGVISLAISCTHTDEGYKSIQLYSYNEAKYRVEEDLLKVINTQTDTVPLKWREYAVPFDFMDDKLLYFKKDPEEILRIGFLGDSTLWNHQSNCRLRLLGMFKGDKWIFGQSISSVEEERVKKRLENEILSRMKYQYQKEE